MAKPDITVPQKNDPSEVWGTGNVPDDLATIVGQALPAVMRDPSNMQQLTVAIDTYLKKAVPEDSVKRVEAKRLIQEQLKRGIGALESCHQRVGFSIG